MGNFQERGAVGPGIGLFPKNIVAKGMMNRTGGQVIAGNIGQVDLLDLATETTTFTPGGENSAWRNVNIPSSAAAMGLIVSPFVVWNETVADDQPGEVTLVGVVTAAVAVPGAVGDRLTATTTTQNLTIVGGTGSEKIIAIRLTVGTGTPGTSTVLFNGDEGFGYDVA